MDINIKESSILIADDMPKNVQILGQILSSENFEVLVAENGVEVLEIVAEQIPDLFLLDVMMPQMDGLETAKKLKENDKTRDIPIIFITARSEKEHIIEGFAHGAVDYIVKPFDSSEVKARVRSHLELKHARDMLNNQNQILEQMVDDRTRKIQMLQRATLISLSTLAEYRDPETGGHILRTQDYMRIIGEEVLKRGLYKKDLDEKKLNVLVSVTPLHDIGKVGVPDHILLKPGKLTPEEFEEMKKHVIYGKNAMERAKDLYQDEFFFETALEVIMGHHEEWNGGGYPSGLKGEEICLAGRMMAIADVYDALISKRVYKDPIVHNEALEIMIKQRGQKFEPLLFDIFLEVSDLFRETAIQNADSDEEKFSLLNH